MSDFLRDFLCLKRAKAKPLPDIDRSTIQGLVKVPAEHMKRARQLIAEVLDDAPASNEKLQALDLEVTLLAASYERSLIAHGKKLAKLSTREEALKVMYCIFSNSELERILF